MVTGTIPGGKQQMGPGMVTSFLSLLPFALRCIMMTFPYAYLAGRAEGQVLQEALPDLVV